MISLFKEQNIDCIFVQFFELQVLLFVDQLVDMWSSRRGGLSILLFCLNTEGFKNPVLTVLPRARVRTLKLIRITGHILYSRGEWFLSNFFSHKDKSLA